MLMLEFFMDPNPNLNINFKILSKFINQIY